LPRFDEEGSLHIHNGEDDGCDSDDYDVEDEKACMGRAVLKKYRYESESDENTEEVEAAKQGKESKAKESTEGKKDEESDEGNEGDDEGQEEETSK